MVEPSLFSWFSAPSQRSGTISHRLHLHLSRQGAFHSCADVDVFDECSSSSLTRHLPCTARAAVGACRPATILPTGFVSEHKG